MATINMAQNSGLAGSPLAKGLALYQAGTAIFGSKPPEGTKGNDSLAKLSLTDSTGTGGVSQPGWSLNGSKVNLSGLASQLNSNDTFSAMGRRAQMANTGRGY